MPNRLMQFNQIDGRFSECRENRIYSRIVRNNKMILLITMKCNIFQLRMSKIYREKCMHISINTMNENLWIITLKRFRRWFQLDSVSLTFNQKFHSAPNQNCSRIELFTKVRQQKFILEVSQRDQFPETAQSYGC